MENSAQTPGSLRPAPASTGACPRFSKFGHTENVNDTVSSRMSLLGTRGDGWALMFRLPRKLTPRARAPVAEHTRRIRQEWAPAAATALSYLRHGQMRHAKH